MKWLGDGVMFHFEDPSAAVLTGLDLVEQTPAAVDVRARVGINAGNVAGRLARLVLLAWAASRIRNRIARRTGTRSPLSPGSPHEARDGRESVPIAGGKCRGERHDPEPPTHPTRGSAANGSGHHQGVPDRLRPAGQTD